MPKYRYIPHWPDEQKVNVIFTNTHTGYTVKDKNELKENTRVPKTGKPSVGLLPGKALYEVAKQQEFGANKHGRHNWREGYPFSKLVDAMGRHYFEVLSGDLYDKESGALHFAAIALNCLYILEFWDEHQEWNDLYMNKESKEKLEGKK